MPYRLYIGVPSGFAVASADLVAWFWRFGIAIGQELARATAISKAISNDPALGPDLLDNSIVAAEMDVIMRGRIVMSRNQTVRNARESGATHLLMVDPDMGLDRYAMRSEPDAAATWPTLWAGIRQRPGSIVAVPYCGYSEEAPVHVFSADGTGKFHRISRKYAASMHGWAKVAAVGTGFMLIDMSVFDRLDEADAKAGLKRAYFEDVYADWTQSELKNSPDVFFCQRCAEAGVPIYVNFDCWAGHWQNQVVERPRDERVSVEAGASEGRLRKSDGGPAYQAVPVALPDDDVVPECYGAVSECGDTAERGRTGCRGLGESAASPG